MVFKKYKQITYIILKLALMSWISCLSDLTTLRLRPMVCDFIDKTPNRLFIAFSQRGKLHLHPCCTSSLCLMSSSKAQIQHFTAFGHSSVPMPNLYSAWWVPLCFHDNHFLQLSLHILQDDSILSHQTVSSLKTRMPHTSVCFQYISQIWHVVDQLNIFCLHYPPILSLYVLTLHHGSQPVSIASVGFLWFALRFLRRQKRHEQEIKC